MSDNKQIDETLHYARDTSPVDTDQLIVRERNGDEPFQNFVWHTRDVDVSHAKMDSSEVLPVDKDKEDVQIGELACNSKSLVVVLIRVVLCSCDLLAQGAFKAAEALHSDNISTTPPHKTNSSQRVDV